MNSNQMYFVMDTIPYQESEPYLVHYEPQQQHDAFHDVFYYQTQDIQFSPVTDNSSSGESTIMSSETTNYWQGSPSQTSFHEWEQSDELFDNILKADLSNEQMNTMLQEIEFDDQLLDFDSFTSDFSDYSTSAPTSANSSPKRKYSSSSSCYSYDFSDCSASPAKKARKPRKTLPDRKERKKEQNKKAAIKYREKKKNQQQESNETVADLESRNTELSKEFASLQNEMKVILPLAKAAFNCNPYKRQQLELLLGRLDNILS